MLRELTATNRPCAIASINANCDLEHTHWSATEFRSCRDWPTGQDFPPRQDWLALIPTPVLSHVHAHRTIQRLEPLPGHNLIVLTIGSGSDNSMWHCSHYHDRTVDIIDHVRLIGSPNIALDSLGTETHEPFEARWDRLAHALSPQVLRTIRDQRVMVFGASRNGSILARELAAIGVTRLSLVDPDILEIHNFDAMLGGDCSRVGDRKVDALADELVRFRDDMAVTCLPWTATDRRVVDHARTADVYFTCVDHGTPILLAAKMANRWNKLHIDVGTNVQHIATGRLEMFGDVRTMFPHQACVACVGGIPDRAQANLDLQLPAGSVPLRFRPDFRTERAGSLVTINALTVSIAVQNFIEIMANRLSGSNWTRINWTASHPEIRSEMVVSPGGCKVCGS